MAIPNKEEIAKAHEFLSLVGEAWINGLKPMDEIMKETEKPSSCFVLKEEPPQQDEDSI